MEHQHRPFRMHRWFKFSERTLLLVMLTIRLATIWWAHWAKRQQNPVASISRMG